MLWETIALGIVNELYFRTQLAQAGTNALNEARQTGTDRLNAKIQRLKKRSDISFIEFGTRRRFSRDWQAEVVQTLAEAVPEQILGTSNVALARETGLQPVGTMAHELFMVLAAHAHATEGTPDAIRSSHGRVIDTWWDEYGASLSIALTDTFGTDFSVRDLTAEQASQWKGQRQDSGSPFEFVDKMIRFYEGHGIDPETRLAVFSDGLNLDTIIEIVDYVGGRMRNTFGWGTNLTNDLGFQPLSLVLKAVEASGKSTVKLSDNLAKATGPEDVVDLYKSVFGYTGTLNEQCVY
jgi:nicotinate phosphoribosyltransferase